MEKRMTKTAFVAGAVVLAVTLSGCGSSGEKNAASSSPSTSSSAAATSAAPSSTAQASGPNQTVAEYLQESGITQTLVKRGDAGTPRLNLPLPTGWADVGADTPQDAWGAIYLESAAESDNPPAIIARMARLTGGEVDQAKILELAPNAVRNQPGYEGPEVGQPVKLGGFDATEISGTVVQDGQQVFVTRRTVVIPGKDAVYLLALDAQAPMDQQDALVQAMSEIDSGTAIEP